jgi:hypothetical protein
MKTKAIVISVVTITAIIIVLSINKNMAQNGGDDRDWSYNVTGDSIINCTLTKTRFGKTSHEIIINFDNINKKIIAVKEDGVSIQPSQYANYLHYIESGKKVVEGARDDMEEALLGLNKMQTQVMKHNLQIKKILQTMVSKLETSGYKLENKSFKIEYKNFWLLNFSDKIYLDNKLLPEDITRELLSISKDFKFDSRDTISLPNLSKGLNEEILSIDKEIKKIKPELIDK